MEKNAAFLQVYLWVVLTFFSNCDMVLTAKWGEICHFAKYCKTMEM